MTDLRMPEALACLTRAEASHDSSTNAHEHRVAAVIYSLGRKLDLGRHESKQIAMASVLHDIGKLSIPVEILHKPGPLSREEVALMRTHSHAGSQILAASRSQLMKLAGEIALYHHERYDGTGYPESVSGEQIPVAAQLTAICDIYDALRSDRSYKRAISHRDAVEIITGGDNRTMPSHFAPRILEGFVSMATEADRIFSLPQTELSTVMT